MSDFNRKPSSRRYLALRGGPVRAMAVTAGAILLLTLGIGYMRPDATSRVLAMGRPDAGAQDGVEQRVRSERGEQDAHRSGQAIFRYDTFGDEQLWTNVLRINEPLATLSPATALAVGLKVDVEALPAEIVRALQAGQVDLTNPAGVRPSSV